MRIGEGTGVKHGRNSGRKTPDLPESLGLCFKHLFGANGSDYYSCD